jgi:hypothetical protein
MLMSKICIPALPKVSCFSVLLPLSFKTMYYNASGYLSMEGGLMFPFEQIGILVSEDTSFKVYTCI